MDLLRVNNLRTWFGNRDAPVRAVDGVSFAIPEGGTVALVGESGCGKSVTALSLAGLASPGFHAGGEVLYRGEDVLRMGRRELLVLRGSEIAYVFQDPSNALNPVFTIGYQVREGILLHRPETDAVAESLSLMRMVGLPDPERSLRAYPHELSGGMKQRAAMAVALACRPRLLVADEPTTALDATIQAQILEKIAGIQHELNMALLIITHNLGLVAGLADRVYVMYAGRVVESGPVEDVLSRCAHPYTRGLLDAVPRLGGAGEEGPGRELRGIDGSVPHPARLPAGCKFAPRCPKADAKCREEEPGDAGVPTDRAGPGNLARHVRCWYPLNGSG